MQKDKHIDYKLSTSKIDGRTSHVYIVTYSHTASNVAKHVAQHVLAAYL
jgi:hypothetical protein